MKLIASSFFLLLFALTTSNVVISGERTVVNKSGENVTGLMVAPAGTNSWNSVYQGSFTNGHKMSFSYEETSGNCVVNVKFINGNGKEYLLENIDLCASSEIVLTTTESTNVESIDVPVIKR
ncbi:MAG: hypothetical protein IAE93_11935 [Ignavibacteria bacterium]|nr:hypothetical protein [Ignavibacteria bacterium]